MIDRSPIAIQCMRIALTKLARVSRLRAQSEGWKRAADRLTTETSKAIAGIRSEAGIRKKMFEAESELLKRLLGKQRAVVEASEAARRKLEAAETASARVVLRPAAGVRSVRRAPRRMRVARVPAVARDGDDGPPGPPDEEPPGVVRGLS